MFCPKCGRQNPDGARFCGVCGEVFPQEMPWASQGAGQGMPQKSGGGAKRGVLVGAIAAAVVVLALVLGFVFTRKTPAKQLEYAGEQAARIMAQNLSDSVSSSGVSPDNMRNQGSIQLKIDSSLLNMFSSLSGVSDLDWLQSAALDFDLSRKDDSFGGDFTAFLGGKKILSMEMFLDLDTETVSIKIPELSSKYAEMDMDDLSLDYSTRQMLGMMTSASYQDGIGGLNSLLSDSKAMGKMLAAYIGVVTENLQDVNRSKGSLEAAGITARYTELTGEIDAGAAEQMAEDFLDALRGDRQMEKLIRAYAGLSGQDPDEAYAELMDNLDYSGDIDIDMDEPMELTVWVDGKSAIHGFRLTVPDQSSELFFACPEDGRDIGFELRVSSYGSDDFLLTGSGTKSGSKLNGTYTLYVDGEEILDIGLEDCQSEKGKTQGRILLTPSREIVDSITQGSGMYGISTLVRSVSLAIDLDTSGNQGTAAYRLLQAGDEMISLTVSVDVSKAGRISAPSSTVSVDAWGADVANSGNLSVLADNLASAGVPREYLTGLR